MTQNVKSKTARENAYHKTRKAIFLGHFPPGHHLKEEPLAEFCGVSRTPMRQALRMLVDEGLVTIGENKRCYVSDVTEAHSEEIFDMMVMLEGYSARLAAEKITDEQIETLRDLHNQMVELVKNEPSNDEAFLVLNSQFHRTIHSASGNNNLIDMIGKIVDYPQTIYLKFGQRSENETSLFQHAAILSALENRDADFSERQMQNHVETIRRQFREIWVNG